MKTDLDTGGENTLFLESLEYDCAEQHVVAVVIEGFSSPEPETLEVGKKEFTAYPLEPSDRSRRFRVTFPRPVAWQCVDECFTAWNDQEERDDPGYLQVIAKSPYRDYVMANHGWHEEVAGPSKHYRLWTADEVLDVVSLESPTIEKLP